MCYNNCVQALGGGERRAWYQLHAHAHNFPRFWEKLDIFHIAVCVFDL